MDTYEFNQWYLLERWEDEEVEKIRQKSESEHAARKANQGY